MDEKNLLILKLQNEVSRLNSEVKFLRKVLEEAHISIDRLRAADTRAEIEQESSLLAEKITPTHAQFMYSMFKGRKDVYSKRAILKNGR